MIIISSLNESSLIVNDINNIDIEYINIINKICTLELIQKYINAFNYKGDNIIINENDIKDISIIISELKKNNNLNIDTYAIELYNYCNKYNLNDTINNNNINIVILAMLYILKQYIIYKNNYIDYMNIDFY